MILTPIKKIIIQDIPVFEKTVSKGFKEVCKFPNYKVGDGVVSRTQKFTTRANTCSVLGMSNGEETYIGHFAPEDRSFNFLDTLDYIIKSFKDKTGKATAVLTGGYDYAAAGGSTQAQESFSLGANIAGIVDKNGIPLSMVFGKKNPVFTDTLAAAEDAFILSAQPKSGYINPLKFNKNPNKQELLQILENNYRVAEIEPEHSICFEV
ncbi:MAG: hypothetical protein LUB59_07425 [Candidatus Gastranaerophilales bacterium]|nr:hypothetical protein [Candidatus Gastranaerophilales bacterium]